MFPRFSFRVGLRDYDVVVRPAATTIDCDRDAAHVVCPPDTTLRELADLSAELLRHECPPLRRLRLLNVS